MHIFGGEGGIEGWRVMLFLWGFVSIFVGIVGYFFLFDPMRGEKDLDEPEWGEGGEGIWEEEEEGEKEEEEEGGGEEGGEEEGEEEVAPVEELKISEITFSYIYYHIFRNNSPWFILLITTTFHTIPWVGFSFLILWYVFFFLFLLFFSSPFISFLFTMRNILDSLLSLTPPPSPSLPLSPSFPLSLSLSLQVPIPRSLSPPSFYSLFSCFCWFYDWLFGCWMVRRPLFSYKISFLGS